MDVDHEEDVSSEDTPNGIFSREDLIFVRVFVGHRMLTVADTMKAYKDIFNTTDEGEFKNKIKFINDGISVSGVKLQLTTCEATGCEYYSFIQTNYNQNYVWPSKYTNNELIYFKRIIQELLSTENGCLTNVEMLNLCGEIISMTSAEKAVESFINDKWIIPIRNDGLYLSCLAIAELEPFLKDQFSDQLRHCELCNKMIFHGTNCHKCNCIIHKKCFEMYNDQYCPRCKSLFKS